MTTTRTARRFTDLTPSELMDLSPSEWLDLTRSAYDDLMQRKPSEMWPGPYGVAQRGAGEARHHPDCGCERCQGGRHEHGEHDCPRCGTAPCFCACCIGDVDLVVHARVGERRVIPILIENERRREKEIKLDLSGWSTRGGSATPVETVLLSPTTLTLAPCESQTVTLVVQVNGPAQKDDDEPAAENEDVRLEAERIRLQDVGRRLPDVDECVVAIADLRLEGCDHRPLRVAVAVLPRDCDPHIVGCGCGCC